MLWLVKLSRRYKFNSCRHDQSTTTAVNWNEDWNWDNLRQIQTKVSFVISVIYPVGDWHGPSYVGLYMTMACAGISFIQPPPSLPPPPQQTLGTTWREQKPFSRDNHCAQKSSSRNKINRESKAPPLRQSIYKRISRNSHTIWNEKLCGLNN